MVTPEVSSEYRELPICTGVTLFSNNTVQSHRRAFSTPRGALSALVTSEVQDFGHPGSPCNIFRYCIMQEAGCRSPGAVNVIESIADAIYKEACRTRERNTLTSIFDRKPFKPEQFEFYVHIPPECKINETFSKVEMAFNGSHFHSSHWTQLPTIPATVQDARYKEIADKLVPELRA